MLLGIYSSHRFIFDTSIDEELRLNIVVSIEIRNIHYIYHCIFHDSI